MVLNRLKTLTAILIKIRPGFCLLAVVLLLGLHQPRPARAQDPPTLAFLPAGGTLYLVNDETIVLDLRVTSAVDLNGFDITLAYDPAVVSLDAWQHGGMLKNMWQATLENTPGHFRLAAVQLAQPAVSGDGSLLKLTFRTAGGGTSAITLSETSVLVDLDGAKTFPARQPASLLVVGVHDLAGLVRLQGQSTWAGITVTLGVGLNHGFGPYTLQTSSDLTTNLNFTGVVEDTYPLTIQHPRYLNIPASLGRQVTVDRDLRLADLTLRGGNAVWTDNVIDVSDVSVVGAWYGKTLADLGPGQELLGDLNFDGVVNIQDVALVSGNYGLSSQEAYGNWSP